MSTSAIMSNTIILCFILLLSNSDGFLFSDPTYYLTLFEVFNHTGKPIEFKQCDVVPGDFGADIPQISYGCYQEASPTEACSAVTTTPVQCPVRVETFDAFVYALVDRGTCEFLKKARNVEKANYSGIFIINNVDGRPEFPHAGGTSGDDVGISVIGISLECGRALRATARDPNVYFSLVASNDVDELGKYLWPFVAVLGICFLIMLLFVLIKFVRTRQRVARRRLSKRNLRKIPTKKFKKGDAYDCCPICLEDFEENEKVRILPCNHAYHCPCVDPWLTKNRKVCPVCKRKVMPSRPGEDSSSDSDGGTSQPPAAGPETERRPLLRNAVSEDALSVGNSTFFSSYHSLDSSTTTVPGFVSAPSTVLQTPTGEPHPAPSTSLNNGGFVDTDDDLPPLFPVGSYRIPVWQKFIDFLNNRGRNMVHPSGERHHPSRADSPILQPPDIPDTIVVTGFRSGERGRRGRPISPSDPQISPRSNMVNYEAKSLGQSSRQVPRVGEDTPSGSAGSDRSRNRNSNNCNRPTQVDSSKSDNPLKVRDRSENVGAYANASYVQDIEEKKQRLGDGRDHFVDAIDEQPTFMQPRDGAKLKSDLKAIGPDSDDDLGTAEVSTITRDPNRLAADDTSRDDLECSGRKGPRRMRHPATTGAAKGGRLARPPPPTPSDDYGGDAEHRMATRIGARNRPGAGAAQPSSRTYHPTTLAPNGSEGGLKEPANANGTGKRDLITKQHSGQSKRRSGRRRGESSRSSAGTTKSAPATLPTHRSDSSSSDFSVSSGYSLEEAQFDSPEDADYDGDMEIDTPADVIGAGSRSGVGKPANDRSRNWLSATANNPSQNGSGRGSSPNEGKDRIV